MPFEKDVDERVWCPGWWPWQWFDTCVEKRHKWCYNFSWVKMTGYGFVIYHEGCEAGRLFTWFKPAFLQFGNLGTTIPLTEDCFDSPRSNPDICDPSNTGLAASRLTPEQQQSDWRYCSKCYAMFFDGFADKGVCPKDELGSMIVTTPTELVNEGRDLTETFIRDTTSVARHTVSRDGRGHVAQGFNFVLPHSVPGSAWAQTDWRYCRKCHTMFFDGFPDKGVCPAGGGHAAAGFNFALPHDISEAEMMQKDWRYCRKCHTLFFNGFSDKGFCPARSDHRAAGFNFVLRYR